MEEDLPSNLQLSLIFCCKMATFNSNLNFEGFHCDVVRQHVLNLFSLYVVCWTKLLPNHV